MISIIRISQVLIALSLLGIAVESRASNVCDLDIPDSGYLRNFQQLSLGKEEWLFREHDLISEFGPDRAGYNGLRDLGNALKKRGTELIIVPLPTRGIVHPEKLDRIEFSHSRVAKNYSLYLERLRKVGLLVPELTQLTYGDQEEPLYFARDHHWTPAGARKTAALVADLLRQTNLLESVTPQVYSTKIIKSDSTSGSYTRAALELCEKTFPPEDFDVYYSETEIDLFADLSSPDVVLVGTSNSNGSKSFNFDGFLRESLGVDVLNMATSGGGFDESLLQYLASAEFQTQPPKILIWEVPGYYNLKQPSFYEDLRAILGE